MFISHQYIFIKEDSWGSTKLSQLILGCSFSTPSSTLIRTWFLRYSIRCCIEDLGQQMQPWLITKCPRPQALILAQTATLLWWWWWSQDLCMWVNEHPPGLHRGRGRGQDGAHGSIHNILQIEFDLDRPRGRVWPAENCGRVHSKSYWSVQRGRKEGVEGGWGVFTQGFLHRGKGA